MILSKVNMLPKFRVNDGRGSSLIITTEREGWQGLEQTAWLQQFIGAKRPKNRP